MTGRGCEKGSQGPSLLCQGWYFVIKLLASVLVVNALTYGGKDIGRSRETGAKLNLILPRKNEGHNYVAVPFPYHVI